MQYIIIAATHGTQLMFLEFIMQEMNNGDKTMQYIKTQCKYIVYNLRWGLLTASGAQKQHSCENYYGDKSFFSLNSSWSNCRHLELRFW